MRAVHPRPRWVLVVGCVAVLGLVAACSSDPEPQSVAMMSEVRPASTGSELPDVDVDADLDDLGLDDLDALFDELEGLDLDELEGVDELFDGLSPDDLGLDPDELGLAACFDELMLYSQLLIASLGLGGMAATERIAAELRDELPPQLHGELDIVTQALAGASCTDLVNGTGPLASSEFARANEAITSWLATDCNVDDA